MGLYLQEDHHQDHGIMIIIVISPCHHDHYDDHDQNYEERVYYVEGEALSVFCAQLAGMGFSLAPNQYTQNIHKTL